MISLELKEAYNNLSTDDKKDKLNAELLVIVELLNNIKNIYGLAPSFEIKNYKSGSFMNEEEFLSFLYEDIFEIEKQLILITNRIASSNVNR